MSINLCAKPIVLALEHGVAVYSTDSGFAGFTEIRLENPLGS